MSKDKRKVIIVKKKVKAHGGHHGGSWKVAYADFVTAMMAFFMVMWILGMDQKLKQAVEGYFSNPIGFKKGYSSGASPISSGASPSAVSTANAMRVVSRQAQKERFEETEQRIRTRLENSEGLGGLSTMIEIIVTDDGLRIELVETGSGNTFFPFGSARLNPEARHALSMIGAELKHLTNPVVIEGHTDAAAFGTSGYSNWELSSDRANAARRVLLEGGVPPYQITEVRGFADRKLRRPDAPYDAVNRRVSIFLPFVLPPTLADPAPAAG